MEQKLQTVKTTRAILYLLLFTPLVLWTNFFFPAMSPKIFWIFFFGEILFFSFSWSCYFLPSLRPKFDRPMIALLIFLTILLLSSLFGVYPQNSIWGDIERNTSMLVWLHLGLVFIVLTSIVRSFKERQRLCFISVFMALVSVFVYFVPTIFSDDVASFLIGGSTLGNSSFFGTYLLFQIFFSLFLTFTGTKKVKWFGILSCLILLITLFSTDARAAMISVVGGAILFLAFLLSHQKIRLHKATGFGLLALLAVVFLVTITLVFKSGSSLNTWITQHGSGSRFVVWDIAWEAFKERPLLGWGPENFRYAFLEYYDPCFGGTFCGGNILFDKAHNIILDTLVDAGILGLLAYLFLLVALLHKTWTAYRTRLIDVKIAALVTATLAAYFVQNLTVFDTATSLLFFVIFYAIVIGLTSPQKPEIAPSHHSSSFFPVIVTCALPFALFFFVIQPIRGIAAIKTAATSLNTTERLDAYSKGMFISPLGRDVRRDFLGLQTVNLLWGYHPVKDAEYIKKIQPYFSKEITLVKQALQDTIQRSPNDFRAYLYLTKLLHAEGRLFRQTAFSDAMKLLDEAFQKNPKHKVLYWAGVSLLLEQGEIEKAFQFASKAIELSPGQKRTLWNVFLYNLYLGDRVAIEASFTELTNIYPETKKEAEEFLARDSEERKYEVLSWLYYD